MYEHADQRLPCDEVCRRYAEQNGDIDHTLVGRLVRRLFPKVTVKSKRQKDQHTMKVHAGLAWREQTHTEISKESILDLLSGQTSAQWSANGKVCILLMQSPVTVDGNVVTKQVELLPGSMEWKLRVKGQYVNLRKLGIDSFYLQTKECVRTILSIVGKMRFCYGKTSLVLDSSLNICESIWRHMWLKTPYLTVYG